MNDAKITSDLGPIVIIERRALIRDCLARCLGGAIGLPILTFRDIESWNNALIDDSPALIIVNSGDSAVNLRESGGMPDLELADDQVPIVILSDVEDLDRITAILRCGARGYLPSDTSLDVAVEAIRLVLAGGLFVPAHIILADAHDLSESDPADRDDRGSFTTREKDVIDALKKGQPNKAIAFELRLSESSVKTHLRNIMKKLHARNRTEAVVKLNEAGVFRRDQ